MLIVEVGFKLEKNFEYYDKLLKDNGLINDFNVTTHDLYYTNKQLDGLSEKEMKNSCIRLRSCNNEDYQVHNELLNELNINIVKKEELKDYEKNLLKYGYKKANCTKSYGGFQILIDDEERNRKEWNLGDTVDASQNILNFLVNLI